MPFTQEAAEMPENPAVRIFMTGQLLIRPDENGETCEVFVNRSAPDHQLSIEVRLKRDGLPDLVPMRHFGPLAFLPPPTDPPIHGFFIFAQSPNGLAAYVGDSKPGVDPLSLAIDLKKADFHANQDLTVDVQGGRPSIILNDGIFYTADKTQSDLTIKLKRGGQDVRALQPFARLIGANIYLDDGDLVSLRWLQNGLTKVLELEKPPDGSSYEIYIMNDPLYVDPEEGLDHDEFREYYKVLPNVPAQEQLRLDVKFPPGKRGMHSRPCMPVVISGP